MKNSIFNLGNSQHSVNITMSAVKSIGEKKDKLLLDRNPEYAQNISSISSKHLSAVKIGVEAALESGPKLFCPVSIIIMNYFSNWF